MSMESAPITPERLAEIELFITDDYVRWGSPSGDVLNALEDLYNAVLIYRAALQRIADDSPASPEGRAAWYDVRRVLAGEVA